MDLIPGRPAAVDGVIEQWDAELADLTAMLEDARIDTESIWTGLAADAFRTAHSGYLTTVEHVTEIGQQIRDALYGYREALATAQDQAQAALERYRWACRRHAQVTSPGMEVAANAEQERLKARAAADQAYRMLDRARADLATAGDHTGDTLRTAGRELDDIHLEAPSPSSGTVTVAEPVDGVHDSLSRIAARVLGSPRRWPEIYHLNQGHVFPDGRRFSNPNDIQPGWTLQVPTSVPVPVHHHGPAALTPHGPAPGGPAAPPPGSPPQSTMPPTGAPPTTGPGPSHPAMPTPPGHPVGPPVGSGGSTGNGAHAGAAPTPAPPASSSPHPGPVTTGHARPAGGWDLGGGLVLGGGVVAALGAVAAAVGVRGGPRRSRPSDGATPPVVRRLAPHTARPSGRRRSRADTTSTGESSTREATAVPGRESEPGGSGMRPVAIGTRDDHELLLDLAATFGLGMTGPGAPAALHALIISLLTSHPDAHLHLPAATAALLHVGTPGPGRRIHQHPNLTGILDHAEAQLVTRTRLLEESAGAQALPPLVILAHTSDAEFERDQRRLQAIADNGGGLGITVLIAGAWPAGTTCHVNTQGTIVRASGPGSAALVDARTFRVPPADVPDILALLEDDTAIPSPRDSTRSSEPGRHDQRPTKRASQRPTTTTPRPGLIAARLNPDSVPATATDPTATRSATAHPAEPDGTTGQSTGRPAVSQRELEILTPPPRRATTPGVGADPAVQPVSPAHSADGDIATTQRQSDGDEPHGTAAPTVAADHHPAVDPGADKPISLSMLGSFQVRWNPNPGLDASTQTRHDITAALQPKTRELLILLALHPDGITRDALVAALWGQDPPTRPTNALHTALSRLRRALATATGDAVPDITVVGDGHYSLNPALVEVDYWRFADAVTARRAAATETDRIDAYRQVVAGYRGPLAEGLATEWIHPVREAIRRDAIDAVAALARALVRQDPQQTLDLLEIARAFDPHNELLYRDIMRLQARLGQYDAIPRTLGLLTTRLREINEHPTPDTHQLATALEHPPPHQPPNGSPDSPPDRLPGRPAAAPRPRPGRPTDRSAR